jgi:hypothetical protein
MRRKFPHQDLSTTADFFDFRDAKQPMGPWARHRDWDDVVAKREALLEKFMEPDQAEKYLFFRNLIEDWKHRFDENLLGDTSGGVDIVLSTFDNPVFGGAEISIRYYEHQSFEVFNASTWNFLQVFGIAAADFDGDGDLEIVYNNFPSSGQGDVRIFETIDDARTNSNFVYQTPSRSFAFDLMPLDINGDGLLDIAGSFDSSTGGKLSLYLNQGGAQTSYDFTRVDYDIGFGLNNSLQAGDLDGDGDLDIVSNSENAKTIVLLNDGTDTPGFTELTIGEKAFSSIIVDINDDGKLDIVYGGVSTGLRFATNLGDINGDGVVDFSDEQFSPVGHINTIVTADLDGNGLMDLFVMTNTTEALVVRQFKGSYQTDFLTLEGELGLADASVYAAAADMDQDGDMDIVYFAYTSTEPELYLIENFGILDGELDFRTTRLPSPDSVEGAQQTYFVLGDFDSSGAGPFTTPGGLPYLGEGLPYTADLDFA